jgi:hypothetical protein
MLLAAGDATDHSAAGFRCHDHARGRYIYLNGRESGWWCGWADRRSHGAVSSQSDTSIIISVSHLHGSAHGEHSSEVQWDLCSGSDACPPLKCDKHVARDFQRHNSLCCTRFSPHHLIGERADELPDCAHRSCRRTALLKVCWSISPDAAQDASDHKQLHQTPVLRCANAPHVSSVAHSVL